jgi:hypothetical protein
LVSAKVIAPARQPERCAQRKMGIKIKSADELNKLFNALALEIVDANIYHWLYSDLVDSIKDNTREFSQSNTFWHFTFDALHDARMIRLCRVFDQEPNSLNLFNLLETIKANVHFFDKEHFRQRLKDNAFVDSLAEVDRIPNELQLDKDIWFASDQNPLVKKLMIWRNNIIAHRGAKVSVGKDHILANNPLSQQEIETLLDKCFAIFNRYSSLYRASTRARKVVGHDDYKSLLKFIKLGLRKWDEDIEKELRELNRRQAQQDTPADG